MEILRYMWPSFTLENLPIGDYIMLRLSCQHDVVTLTEPQISGPKTEVGADGTYHIIIDGDGDVTSPFPVLASKWPFLFYSGQEVQRGGYAWRLTIFYIHVQCCARVRSLVIILYVMQHHPY